MWDTAALISITVNEQTSNTLLKYSGTQRYNKRKAQAKDEGVVSEEHGADDPLPRKDLRCLWNYISRLFTGTDEAVTLTDSQKNCRIAGQDSGKNSRMSYLL